MKKRYLLPGIALLLLNNCFASWAPANKLMDEALINKVFPGASVYVGDSNLSLYQYSVGDSDGGKIYDVASLTKVVVTTTLVMILEEKGLLSLDDKVKKFFPEFSGDVKNKVTLEDLMRHRSGLPSGARPEDGESLDDYLKRITSAKLSYIPRTKTVYSDLSFILLGKVVEIVSNKSLSQLAHEMIFAPLSMDQSSFKVAPADLARCAPTSQTPKCEVHDPTAFAFLPLSVGNAGLFSTLEDLSDFARMILNRGELNGVRILSEKTVEKMLTKDGLRGLGWDYVSEYSTSPRGEVFPEGISFGHTGYTGAAIWIDPKSKTFYVLLSNRVALGDEATKKPFGEFRKKISTEIGRKIYSSQSN